MRIHHLETLKNHQDGRDDSLILEQRFSHGHRKIRAASLAVSGALLCLPFIVIFLDQAARARLLELSGIEPLVGLKLSLAAVIGLAALYFGLAELLRAIVRERVIKIDRDHAIVEDFAAGTKRFWQEPLQRYNGIRHLVQTRSSGPVHLVMLEHSRPSRSLCIAYGTQLDNQAIIDAAHRYNLPVLSGKRLDIAGRLAAILPTFTHRALDDPLDDQRTPAAQAAGT